MRRRCVGSLIAFMIVLALAACSIPPFTPAAPQRPTEGSLAPPSPAPAAGPPATAFPGDLPAAVEYNLGEATIVQERFPEGNRFRFRSPRV